MSIIIPDRLYQIDNDVNMKITSTYIYIYIYNYILQFLLKMTGAFLAGEFRDIKCQNIHAGRFVAIYFDHPGTLTVCEFEVFGGKVLLRTSQKYSSLEVKVSS